MENSTVNVQIMSFSLAFWGNNLSLGCQVSMLYFTIAIISGNIFNMFRNFRIHSFCNQSNLYKDFSVRIDNSPCLWRVDIAARWFLFFCLTVDEFSILSFKIYVSILYVVGKNVIGRFGWGVVFANSYVPPNVNQSSIFQVLL